MTQAIRVRSNIGYKMVSQSLGEMVGDLTVIIIGYSASRHVYEVLRGEWECQEQAQIRNRPDRTTALIYLFLSWLTTGLKQYNMM